MTEIEIDKIIDYFLKNSSKPVGKPYIWVDEEEKEEMMDILK